jgi:hypothetical protein
MDIMRSTHWTQWLKMRILGAMSFAMHTTGTGRALSSLREAIRRRRAARRDVAREIAAYPATRSAAPSVLPPSRRDVA